MKKIMMRVLSVLLCVALLVPPMAPRAEAAVTAAAIQAFFDSVQFYYGLAEDVLELAGVVLGINYDQLSSPTDIEGTVWETGTAWMNDSSRYVEVDAYDLSDLVRDLDNELGYTGLNFYLPLVTGYGKSYRVVACDGTKNGHSFTYIFTLDGIVLCAPVEDDPFTDIWMPVEYMGDQVVLLNDADFYNKVMDNAGAGCKFEDHTKFLYQTSSGAVFRVAYSYPDRDLVLARSDGKVYACRVNPENSAANQDRPAVEGKDENGDDITIEEGANVGMDIENATVTLPDGSILEMISNSYDESSKTYYVDARTYNEEGDTYIYNTYQYTYHINYTSITYIGQTEEYNKYYEVYYELPDGRSSADLTAEDLEQLNVSVDVIPYGRSADDTSLRSLYHFDGDTKDSSYWNYCTDFTWNKGASLTYMDAGVFNGALYLDETEHDFTLTLPSTIATGDFTLQFRYYQSHTPAPVSDSYISASTGGSTHNFLRFDGSSILTDSGALISSMPIGTWNEIAVIRSSGTVRIYLNGLCVYTYGCDLSFIGEFIFTFGDEQQTFKYLDELRVLNYALVDDGISYEPTSVPHDTNLTLVLPDSQLPVADEYWDVSNPDQENLLSAIGADDWSRGFSSVPLNPLTFSDSGGSMSCNVSGDVGFCTTWAPAITSVIQDGSTRLQTSSLKFRNMTVGRENVCVKTINGSGYSMFYPTGGFYWCLGQGYRTYDPSADSYYNFVDNFLASGTYTFSMVDVEGNIGSLTFNVPKFSSSFAAGTTYSTNFNGYTISVKPYYSNTANSNVNINQGYMYWLSVQPTSNETAGDFVYLELVKGSSTSLKAEFVSSVTGIDKEDLNTPTLAVRTDLEITSYQIGGPRPSVPKKGLVWALIENDRITSLQIYNGSAWEGVDGRIWTGERWIPMSSYNIITLQDMYDIVDATTDFEYIYTETGFWAWWQRSWNDFVKMIDDRLKSIVAALGGSTAGDDITKPDANGNSKFTLIQFFGKVFDKVHEVASDVANGVLDKLVELGSHFVQSIDDFFAGFVVMDLMSTDYFESIGATLSEAGELVSGVWDAVPEEVQTPLVGCFMLSVFGILICIV